MAFFLSKFDSSGNFKWARTWGGVFGRRHDDVAVDESDNAYVTGDFNGTIDFDPGSGIDNHSSNGGDDAFLSKFDSSGNFSGHALGAGMTMMAAWVLRWRAMKSMCSRQIPRTWSISTREAELTVMLQMGIMMFSSASLIHQATSNGPAPGAGFLSMVPAVLA